MSPSSQPLSYNTDNQEQPTLILNIQTEPSNSWVSLSSRILLMSYNICDGTDLSLMRHNCHH